MRSLPTRSLRAALLAAALLALAAAPLAARAPARSSAPMTHLQTRAATAVQSLQRVLARGMRRAGDSSGALVVDLSTGTTLYSDDATVARLPASVEKLYTTTTALTRFGDTGYLLTHVYGRGTLSGGTFRGTLYLRGGGDPTFGAAAFDHAAYGTGATMQHLVANLRAAGVRRLVGAIVADETWFDADRGTPATGNQPDVELEGELSGLAYDRGWANGDGTMLQAHPALTAGTEFALALKAAGVALPRHVSITAGATPRGVTSLAAAGSPDMATLVALTNAPSDNFFAEMLAKDLGRRFGTGGTTAAGVAVIRAQVAKSFGFTPRFDDGSGLSRYDRTTPAQVVTLLRDEAGNADFTGSLAVAGETGTQQDEMRRTAAQGRCRGKTGTLHDVSNVVGYCMAADGHTLAFAFLLNGVYPDYAHPITDAMQVALAKYDG